MIVTRLRGGMGNQLFQYACGRALALRLGTDLALDTRDWSRPRPFALSLGHFSVKTVEPKNLPPGRGMGAGALLRSALGPRLKTYREASLGYDEGITLVTDGTLLKGYWQSERYFKDQEAAIREDLTFSTPPGPETARIVEEIASAPAVSLHIRRGDYVSNAKYNAAHGTTSLSYYQTAAQLIAENMSAQPVIYAFSDDPAWVRENLSLPFDVRFVSHNDGATAHDDLRLMAACNHHIIANSSFSWWGAWLNSAPDKIVVAPKTWYGDAAKSNADITPANWHRL
ncbi:MAG: alpha-1,2-fucosyltransferase [Pseudomonadota bacterium]